ncbi:tubulin polymerization-promoting protein family member 2 isoform X1 [Bubalus kerabau]|uniref:tubulin polymerization-promoting protein family member 2 isoform X1 n=1 Tax=Bubalus carabanensis TaxID=3119969 RepID=UPI00244EBDD6|nr:tubulin polymerization-promoting protein family member 2 isoform X1 [Bubalus carabanensis]
METNCEFSKYFQSSPLPHPQASPLTVLPHLLLTMASEAERTFQRFAVFGESSSSGTEMNNKNFSKLCKDCGIMDGKTVTSTDVDIVFSKVKAKNARTITFQQFQEAMKELGQKRFKGKSPDEALENIYKLMEGKDPATTGVTDLPSLGHNTLSNHKRTLHLIGQKTSVAWPAPCLQLHLHPCLLPPHLVHLISSTQNAALSSHSHPHPQFF